VSRSRTLFTYALITFALVTLFAVFIGFRDNAALVGALSAAGTVAAGGFAAVAAVGSMRAAAESSTAARRSREAISRTARPRIQPGVREHDGRWLGELRCGADRGATDLLVTWLLADNEPAVGEAARLEPDGTFAVELPGPGDQVTLVWLEYWDDDHAARWHDTWEVRTGMFHQTDSTLVD
jgi:hypothetical protein